MSRPRGGCARGAGWTSDAVDDSERLPELDPSSAGGPPAGWPWGVRGACCDGPAPSGGTVEGGGGVSEGAVAGEVSGTLCHCY